MPQSRQGFTLIELLLVLAIIGIISAIAIPALLGQREAARNRATQNNAANVRGALSTALVELDLPTSQRSNDLVAAATVADVLTAIAARDEFDIAKPAAAHNPHDPTKAAYTFSLAAPTVAGEVSISNPTNNPVTGAPELVIGYGIKVKGADVLTSRIGAVDASR